MHSDSNYLSEFEKEFELESFSSEYDGEADFAAEFESDFLGETDEELETVEYELDSEIGRDDEYEFNDEYESDDEYELDGEQMDSENYLQEYGSRGGDFENRLYSALSGEYESSFEMEQEIDRVLHEMEVEYFWKSAKNLWKKHKNKLVPFAKKLLPGGNLTQLVKFAGGDLRNLLKSDLLKKGLTLAANAYLPGVGGAVAGKLLNSEAPNSNANPQEQAKHAVKVAKDAYRNMALLLPQMRSGNVPNQISNLSQQALKAAKNRHSVYKGKTRKVIPIKPNSTVVVRPDRIIIYS